MASAWVEENRLKTEGGLVVATVGTAVGCAPAWCWGTATAYPLGFGLCLTAAGLAWTVRWEIREQRFTRWLLIPGHAFRWFVPPNTADGWWEWTEGPVQQKRRSATEMHEEWLTEVGRELEEVGS